jgi:hypothetical protein
MMARSTALNRFRALTAGGALLLGVTLWTSSQSQSIDKPDTPLKIALVLDCITQPRFQDDINKFGTSRLLPVAGGHLRSGGIHTETKKDRDLLKSAENSDHDFLIGFFHCAPVPGKAQNPLPTLPAAKRTAILTDRPGPGSPSVSSFVENAEGIAQIYAHLNSLNGRQNQDFRAEEAKNLYSEMGKAAHKALPKLMKGKGTEADAGDWLIVMRPVRAMKATCLTCHKDAKMGDTLGAMAYMVSKKTFADAYGRFGGRP